MAVVGTGAVALAIGLLILSLASAPAPAPPRPQPPPPSASLVNSEQRFSPYYYKALIEEDATAFGVPVPSYEELQQPNAYFDELHQRQRLRLKVPVETRHLRITLDVSKETTIIESHSLTSDHFVLRIENRTPYYLAYRVDTAVTDKQKCGLKAEIPHNAIAIEPEQTILRTECILRKDASIDLTRIEVIELPALSAYYVSRLPPNPVLFDARTSAGHLPSKGTLCAQTFSWRDIKDGLSRHDFGWRDVIDFYARHTCAEYSFYASYRYRGDPTAPLPARSLD
jgi:hypothetical protein